MYRWNVLRFVAAFISLWLSSRAYADPPICGAASWDGVDACATYGDCDDYQVRDTYIHYPVDDPTRMMHIRLRFVVFADDNDFLLASPQDVADQFQILKSHFETSGIAFTAETATVYESPYWNFSVGDMCIFHEDQPDMCRVGCINPPNDTNGEYDMKYLYGEDAPQQINIYVVNFDAGLTAAWQYYPWCPLTTDVMGGVIVGYNWFGKKCGLSNNIDCQTVTHEIAHNLGLWHTFRGVSEVGYYSCETCSELAVCNGSPGNTQCDAVGDFCSDTPAAAVNGYCHSIAGLDCEGTALPDADWTNYMDYGIARYGLCADHFTAQQARGECTAGPAIGCPAGSIRRIATPTANRTSATSPAEPVVTKTSTACTTSASHLFRRVPAASVSVHPRCALRPPSARATTPTAISLMWAPNAGRRTA